MQYMKHHASFSYDNSLTPRSYLEIAAVLSIFGVVLAACLPFMG